MKKDYYQILGVKRTASTQEIKAAYRNLAKKHHPDMTGRCEDDQHFKDIHEAYSTLIDPEKRKTYNQTLGEKVKVNVIRTHKTKNSFFHNASTQPEPLIPKRRQTKTISDDLWEEEWRYFERLRQYLLRRFFDDDFFF